MDIPTGSATARSDVKPVTAPAPTELLDNIMAALPECAEYGRPGTATYRALTAAALSALVPMFGPDQNGAQRFASFGSINFPYRRMGAIDSLQLFGLDELFIFAFYWANRHVYRRTADVGANIGLHSLIMTRCGFSVTSYEPDPTHVRILRENLANNAAADVEIVEAAVSDHRGEAEFIRLLGNTTGSHLAGAKSNLYGAMERFMVPVVPASDVIGSFDLAKIDAEGQEATILLSTRTEQWVHTDVMLEIGSEKNAQAIFSHCERLNLCLFAQKTGWRRARKIEDVPTSYREGSAFITRKQTMPGFGI